MLQTCCTALPFTARHVGIRHTRPKGPRVSLCGPFEIVAAAARSGPQTAKPPARLGVVATQGRGATTPPPRFVPGGGGGPRGRNTATTIQGRFSAPGTLAGKIVRQPRQKKSKAATRPKGLALLFFWAAQAAQTFAPQGPAGASARPHRPGGRTAARAGTGRRHRTRPRPCAVGLPGVWMAARYRCRQDIDLNRWMSCRYVRPPGRTGWEGAGGGAEGRAPRSSRSFPAQQPSARVRPRASVAAPGAANG